MNKFKDFLKRHPLSSFLVLAYGVGWLVPLYHLINPSFFIPLYPPVLSVCAIVLVYMIGGWANVRSLLASFVKWRIPVQWYLVALLLPVGLTLGAVLVNLSFGAVITAAPYAWYWFFPLLPLILLLEGGPHGRNRLARLCSAVIKK